MPQCAASSSMLTVPLRAGGSIDFMVCDPASAPRDQRAFRAWYREQTDWADNDDCYDPSITSPAIQSWYRQMTSQFPDANSPGLDLRAIDERYGDYNFGRHICYVALRSDVAVEAWALTQSIAAQHQLGTYDPNSDDERSGDSIRFPDGPIRPDSPDRGGILSFFGKKR